MHGAVEQRVHGSAAEGWPPGRRVRQEAAQREDVARGPERRVVGGGLLRGEEAGGADDETGGGERGGLAGPGDPEVDQPGPVGAEQDVAGFDVAVDETGLVHGGQRAGQQPAQHPYGACGQRAAAGDRLGERRARHERGGDPGPSGLGVGVDHLDGPRAAHAPGGLGLPTEAGSEVLVPGVLREDHLDRQGRPGLRTPEVDHAHAARAEASEQPVAADAGGVGGP